MPKMFFIDFYRKTNKMFDYQLFSKPTDTICMSRMVAEQVMPTPWSRIVCGVIAFLK